MVKIVEQSELSRLGDVIVQSIGLTGVITVGALLFGLVLALMIIGYRKIRANLEPEDQAGQTQPLGLTPPAHR